jgi:hypothetical protein
MTPMTQKSARLHSAGPLRLLAPLCLLGMLWQPLASSAEGVPQAPAAVPHDGQHDFDFSAGKWHTHIVRTLEPFNAKSATITIDGTVSSHKVWDGRAWLEEIEADTPKGHWEGLNLFLYNPASHQWSQSFSNSSSGTLGTSFVGEFKDGRAELLSTDTFNGKSILVRAVWSNITRDAHRYEEFFSDDGGKSWKLSFVANKTRVRAEEGH